MAKKDIFIIGTGGHSRVIIDCAEKNKFNIKGLIDINYSSKNNNNELILNYPILGDFEYLKNLSKKTFSVFLAIGDNLIRKKFYELSLKQNFHIETLKSSNSIISDYTHIDEGVYIGSGAIINSESRIGKNTIINSGTIIEHETIVGDFSHVGPGTKVAGRVSIGNFVNIGIGVNIKNNVNIGNNVIIGAGSVIIKDIPSDVKVAGVPAKII